MNRTLLVWRYFFQQKYKEIAEHGTGAFILSFIIGYALCLGAFLPEKNIWWLGFIAFFIAGFWILLGLIFLIRITCRWLYNNWKLANERADREIKSAKGRASK